MYKYRITIEALNQTSQDNETIPNLSFKVANHDDLFHIVEVVRSKKLVDLDKAAALAIVWTDTPRLFSSEKRVGLYWASRDSPHLEKLMVGFILIKHPLKWINTLGMRITLLCQLCLTTSIGAPAPRPNLEDFVPAD